MKNILDFGAKGDGVTKDTTAIQKALDGGGTVFVPRGTYLTGTLYLRSHTCLELESGAVLLGSPDKADYNDPHFCPQNAFFLNEKSFGAHLLVAVEQEDITIRGPGKIDADSPAWFAKQPVAPGKFIYEVPDWRPSQTLFFSECRGIRLTDFTFANSAYWTCFLHGCEDVTIRGLHIYSDFRVLNDDGIDLDCCQHVTVSDCLIETGDDCIAIRGDDGPLKQKRACEYITIANCILHSGYANAVRIGVGENAIRHLLFQQLLIHDSRTAFCIVSKYFDSPEGNGVDIEDIQIRGLQLTNDERLAKLKLDNGNANYPTRKNLRKITFAQISGDVRLSTYLTGNGIGILQDISFDDLDLTLTGTGSAPDQDANGRWGCDSTDAAFELSQCAGVQFRNVRLTYQHSGWKHDVHATDAKGIATSACCFPLTKSK